MMFDLIASLPIVLAYFSGDNTIGYNPFSLLPYIYYIYKTYKFWTENFLLI